MTAMMTGMIARTEFDSWAGRAIRRVRRRVNEHCINIVAYHSVSIRESLFTDGTTLRHDPATFERQIDYLADRYRPMSLREIVTELEAGRRPERALAITFDDGFADSLRCAMPILRRRRIPMTVFPVAGVIGNKDLMWQHKLAWLVDAGRASKVAAALSAAGYPEGAAEESVEDHARRCFRADLPDILESVLRDVGESGPALAAKLRPYLEEDEIAGADPALVDFGNHTMTHPVLAKLSPDHQRAEIVGAREVLVSLTGVRPIALAYPFGLKPHYSPQTTALARETGHRAALDMRRRINTGARGPFELSRKPACHGPLSDLERMIEDWPANAGGIAGSAGV